MEKNKIKINVIYFISFFLLWYLVLNYFETIKSGFHFTDDHGIITNSINFQKKGYFSTLFYNLSEDFFIRFRPFYIFYTTTICYLFKNNFILYSILNLFLFTITSYSLFKFSLRFGSSKVHALFFVFFTLIGAQSAIWWKLGPAETIGMTCFSIALNQLIKSIQLNKNTSRFISILFIFLSSLSKESFLACIPFYILLWIYLEIVNSHYLGIKATLIKNKLFFILLVSVFISEIVIIIFFVGTNQIQYAGIDNSFSLYNVLKFTYLHLMNNYIFYFLILCLIILFQHQNNWEISYLRKKISRQVFIETIILLSATIPQFLLYTKSGMYERYLLPNNLFLSLYVLFLLRHINSNENILLFSKTLLLAVGVYLISSPLFKQFKDHALHFSKEGIDTNRMLNFITSNTSNSDSIYIFIDGNENYEWTFSIKTYLSSFKKRENIKFINFFKPTSDSFSIKLNKDLCTFFKKDIIETVPQNASCVVFLPFNNSQKALKQLLRNHQFSKKKNIGSYNIFLD